ncbi:MULTISPECIES: chloramphenicol phosphotransferase CPT family protein [unclassified Sinorhizobium]|uniref:chloramphenicol phosphotransferase CPT family protein n=1 Tax=unclassified Sinorhizobium TaxID=2613772 RepID=UPI0035269E7E
MSRTAKIVLLNGVGSAGKSSIAKALQEVASQPLLHVSMDVFIEMLPKTYQEHLPGFSYDTVIDDGKPLVVIKTGPVGEQVLRGMRHAIVAMARQGNNLIVDDVLCDGEMLEYRALLSDFDFHAVGVFASLDVLEERERRRGDRLPGLARWQFDRVHRDINYDLEIETDLATPHECAVLIKEKFLL